MHRQRANVFLVVPSGARDLLTLVTGAAVSHGTYYVYILASRTRRLYTGVTRNLSRRVWEHRSGAVSGHTARYAIDRLVYYEATENVAAAIAREKQIKAWARAKRVAVIESTNAGWIDLAEPWFAGPWRSRHLGR